MLQPIQQFLPALKGGVNLAGPTPGQVETISETFPVSMSGDAWESAALFFIRQRGNPHAWQEIAEFLKAQELAAHGLRLLPSRCSDRGELATHEARNREAHPVGNTGITSTIVSVRSNG
jgi:hypothetical protein